MWQGKFARLALVTLALCTIAACSGNRSRGSSEPNLAQVYADMGGAYLQRGQRDEAREKLQRALDLDPQLPAAHHTLASSIINSVKTQTRNCISAKP